VARESLAVARSDARALGAVADAERAVATAREALAVLEERSEGDW
jgi:hypothetical protein